MWALTADEMKECHWLKPRLVAQIEFNEWTPDQHLRHSSFVGLRDDKEALADSPRIAASRRRNAQLFAPTFASSSKPHFVQRAR